MSLLINLILAIYILVSLLMILVILMQRPKSEGLGAAFGGGVTENIFGAQTTNVLTKATAWLAGLFFILTFTLSILYSHRGRGTSELRRELMKTQTSAAASPAPAKPGNAPQVNVVPVQTPASPPAAGAPEVVPPASAPVATASPAGSPNP
jgi:preprotein translocase subunit SecG